jgi:hypothetical protein
MSLEKKYCVNKRKMSMNRTTYDPCVYQQDLNQSVSPLSFILDPIQHENCNQCRMELGIVGGNAVSHIAGNMVDIESDLRGQTRPSAQCPGTKFLPQPQQPAKHLPPCQMIHYGSVAPTPKVDVRRCA